MNGDSDVEITIRKLTNTDTNKLSSSEKCFHGGRVEEARGIQNVPITQGHRALIVIK